MSVAVGRDRSHSPTHHSQLLSSLTCITAPVSLLPAHPALRWLLATLSAEPGLLTPFVEPPECSSASWVDICYSPMKPKPRCNHSYSCHLWGISWAQGMAHILSLNPHESHLLKRENAPSWGCLCTPICIAPYPGSFMCDGATSL